MSQKTKWVGPSSAGPTTFKKHPKLVRWWSLHFVTLKESFCCSLDQSGGPVKTRRGNPHKGVFQRNNAKVHNCKISRPKLLVML